MQYRIFGEDAVITNRPYPPIEAVDMPTAIEMVKASVFKGCPASRLKTETFDSFTELSVQDTMFRVRIVPPGGPQFPFPYGG